MVSISTENAYLWNKVQSAKETRITYGRVPETV